jgi:hypothetical protein
VVRVSFFFDSFLIRFRFMMKSFSQQDAIGIGIDIGIELVYSASSTYGTYREEEEEDEETRRHDDHDEVDEDEEEDQAHTVGSHDQREARIERPRRSPRTAMRRAMRRAQRRRLLYRSAASIGIATGLVTCFLPDRTLWTSRRVLPGNAATVLWQRWNEQDQDDNNNNNNNKPDTAGATRTAALFSPVQDTLYYPSRSTTSRYARSAAVANGNGNSMTTTTTTTSTSRHASSSTAASSSSTDVGMNNNNNNNPTVYGWTPEPYPNPLRNPLRCGVAFLVESYSNNYNNMNNNAPPQQQQPPQPPQHLRLCDPDWMLGGIVLTDVASAMLNFTETFGEKVVVTATTGSLPTAAAVAVAVPPHDEDEDETATNTSSATTASATPATTTTTTTPTNVRILLRGNSSDRSSRHGGRQMSSLSGYIQEPITLAVAAVSKMNVEAVLRQANYYTYEEDEDDMISDAAQIFARQLHESWAVGDYGILLFLSVQDRICFISTGSGLTDVLPWWRLDQIVTSMKPDLRHRDYGNAILEAIEDLTTMLTAGSPTWWDRLYDFIGRYVFDIVPYCLILLGMSKRALIDARGISSHTFVHCIFSCFPVRQLWRRDCLCAIDVSLWGGT